VLGQGLLGAKYKIQGQLQDLVAELQRRLLAVDQLLEVCVLLLPAILVVREQLGGLQGALGLEGWIDGFWMDGWMTSATSASSGAR
jgi:hypothetical protein